MEFFPNVPKIAYKGPDSTDPLSYRYYNADEVILGKTMKVRRARAGAGPIAISLNYCPILVTNNYALFTGLASLFRLFLAHIHGWRRSGSLWSQDSVEALGK